MALSQKFHWVEVDRDKLPDLPRHYGVSAYPTLLVLGDRDEKIHRFSGFRKPAELAAELEDALRRFALYREGEEWDVPAPRPESICDEGTVETFPAPGEEIPDGLCLLGGSLWIGQERRLRRVDLARAEVAAEFALPESVIDLCTDGARLYALEYGWTAGQPIHVLDPGTGKELRAIVTEANRKNRAYGAKGIAWRDGKLWVLEGMQGTLHEVDPDTGVVSRRLETEGRWLAGLAFDGTCFVAGGRDALWFLDPETGKTVRKVAVNYPLRSVAAGKDAVYVMEQPVFGFDKAHQRVRVWPTRTLVHKLSLNR